MTQEIYKLPKICLNKLQKKQRELLDAQFEWDSDGDSAHIALNPRGYVVNDEGLDCSASDVNAISFFSGAGGLDIGAQLAGVKVISSLDFDRDSIETLKRNRCFSGAFHICADIRDITATTYVDIIKRSKSNKLILIGGPPCQPFSKAGYWVTHKNRLGSEDPRNMIGHYLRLISELRPDGFLLENVESILHPKNKNAVEDLAEAIDTLGYRFICYRADAQEFGVPQKRKRVFFIASRKSLLGEPLKTHTNSPDLFSHGKLLPFERVVDWIGKFDVDSLKEDSEVTEGKTYGTELCEIPPGQNYFALTAREGYPSPKFEANRRFWSFLLKLHPLQPSWTISAQPGPWVGPFHWKNRRLRVSESAAIQTFPDDYFFHGSRRSVQKQIGNAVPPLLGKAMVEFLRKNI